MNNFFRLLVLFCLACCAWPAQAAFINGQNYVPIANWAAANGLKTFWLKRGEEVAVTNRTARLVFDKDSATSEINGINVALSFPVAVDKGAPLIAQFDLDKTIRPLLSPSRYVEPKKSRQSASIRDTVEKTRAIVSVADFSGTTKKLTRSNWRWNCAIN